MSLSAPGARDLSLAQSRLDEPGVAPQGLVGSAGGRSRRVRFDAGPAGQEGSPEAVGGQGPPGSA
eukprot:2952182-Alexandrium_andersonii.AAC.1